jgi:hypothetical protein
MTATAKRRKKTKWPRGERFIGIQLFEFESPAFQQLSADATRVYLFMRRRCNFDGSNNGQVPFSQRDAARALNSSHWRRGANALAELQHYGFVKLRNGGVVGEAIRVACQWQLTGFGCGGQPASKDFMRWDGTVFEPPYRSKLGTRTADQRASEKQVPTAMLHAPPRATALRSRAPDSRNGPKMTESACNSATLSTTHRVQHEHTCTYYQPWGPRERAPDGAPAKRPWRAPSYIEITRAECDAGFSGSARAQRADPPKTALPKAPRGSSREKARWLRERLEDGILTECEVAAALGIERAHVCEVLAGRTGLGSASWRKLAALAAARTHR